MTRSGCLILFAVAVGAHAQNMRHSVEVGASGLFPLSGWKARDYSAGPGLHTGYELRFHPYLGADVGWTGTWPAGTACSRFGCEHPRKRTGLLDFGLRGFLPLGPRGELSVGGGGGRIWFSPTSGDNSFNDRLIQYSVCAAFALDPARRWRLAFTVRAWRDVGRPIQQWLTTTTSITCSLGTR